MPAWHRMTISHEHIFESPSDVFVFEFFEVEDQATDSEMAQDM
jgi:hypothetical protein